MVMRSLKKLDDTKELAQTDTPLVGISLIHDLKLIAVLQYFGISPADLSIPSDTFRDQKKVIGFCSSGILSRLVTLEEILLVFQFPLIMNDISRLTAFASVLMDS